MASCQNPAQESLAARMLKRLATLPNWCKLLEFHLSRLNLRMQAPRDSQSPPPLQPLGSALDLLEQPHIPLPPPPGALACGEPYPVMLVLNGPLVFPKDPPIQGTRSS